MKLRIALIFAGVAAVAVALGVYFGVWQSQSKLVFPRTSMAKAIAPLRFEDANGHALALADFKGKVVLLNIWATWCEPCRKEMPALDRLQAELGGDRFQVVPLSVDQQGVAVARRFYGETGIKALPLYIDPTAQAAFILDAAGLPVTLLVDRAGREIGRHLGAVQWDAPDVVAELRRITTAE